MSIGSRKLAAGGGVAATVFLSTLLGGLLLAALTALRIVELEQPFNPRNLSVVATMAGGGALATVPVLYLGALSPRRLHPALRIALVAAGALVLTLGASASVFAVVLRDFIEGNLLHGDRISFAAVFIPHASAAYLMLTAGWNMMFPWPVPAFAAILAAVAERLPAHRLAIRSGRSAGEAAVPAAQGR